MLDKNKRQTLAKGASIDKTNINSTGNENKEIRKGNLDAEEQIVGDTTTHIQKDPRKSKNVTKQSQEVESAVGWLGDIIAEIAGKDDSP